MKTLKTIIVALLIIVGLVLVVAAFLPRNVGTSKSIEINIPAKVIFNQVNTLKNWEKWTPFTTSDMATEYGSIARGVGASYSWTSDESGNGTLTIKESIPFSSIHTQIDFAGGGSAFGSWDLVEADGKTTVTWSLKMTDLSWPFGRIMGLMAKSGMEPYFTDGLNSLKKICEEMPDYSKINEIDFQPIKAYTIFDSCTMAEVGNKMGGVYTTLYTTFMENHLEKSGPSFCLFHRWDPEGYTLFEAGLPVETPVDEIQGLTISGIKGSKAVEYMHIGPYEQLDKAHELISKYLMDCGLQIAGPVLEEYIVDPSTEQDFEKLETRIVYPVM